MLNTVEYTTDYLGEHIEKQTVAERKVEQRNQLLRRGDWRFLLPASRLEHVACFAGGLFGATTATVAEASRASLWRSAEGMPTPRGCDLAVAANPSPATLAAAERALRPGAALYAEYSRPVRGGIAALRRQLEAAGFTKTAFYFPWPWLRGATPVVWLPIDASTAVDWYARRVEQQAKGGAAVLHRAQWAAWRGALAAGFVFPLAVVAVKPGVGPSSAMSDSGMHGVPYATLLLTGGHRAINKVVGLVFAASRAEPQWVLKFPRTSEAVAALDHEAAVLQALHANRPLPGAPRLLHYTRDRDVPVLGESALAGTPLWQHLDRRSFRPLAQRATDWLIALAEGTRQPPCPAARARRIEQTLADFTAAYGPQIGAEMLQRLEVALAAIGEVPAVCEHGDFSPWNVLLDANGQDLAVLDWESATLSGLPGIDPTYFLTFLGLFLEQVPVHGAIDVAQVTRAYRAQRDPATYVGGVIQACLAHYARCLRLPVEALRPLRLLTWVTQALAEHRLWVSELGAQPTRERLQRSLFLAFLQVDLAHGEPT